MCQKAIFMTMAIHFLMTVCQYIGELSDRQCGHQADPARGADGRITFYRFGYAMVSCSSFQAGDGLFVAYPFVALSGKVSGNTLRWSHRILIGYIFLLSDCTSSLAVVGCVTNVSLYDVF